MEETTFPAASRLIRMLPVVSKRYRRLVYSLLGSLITTGIVLSAVMAWSGAEIRRNATPLLREQVPALTSLGDLEAALLRHQLLVNNWSSGLVGPESFIRNEVEDRQRVQALLGKVAVPLRVAGQTEIAMQLVEKLDQQADRLRRDAELEAAADEKSGVVLAEVNETVRGLQDVLALTRSRLEVSLYESSNRAVESIDKISMLILGFAVMTVVTSVFMLYHARARFTSEGRLAYQAAHDPLTGLAHRRSLEERLITPSAGGKLLILGYVDRFDRVISGLGHGLGDELLRALARRLEAVAAIFNGQAFSLDGTTIALLFERQSMREGADAAIAELLKHMAEAFVLEGHEVFIDLSLGYAHENELSEEPLLKRAGAALQAAMRTGGGVVVEHSPTLHTRSLSRLDMESDLRHAMERDELELFYQPQLDLATGRLAGFEALIRWRRGDQLVSPAEFIPIAEESGLIIPMGSWILEQACWQARRWNEALGSSGHSVKVAVNLSMRQFLKGDFLESVEQCLLRTGVDPSHIELELTESAAMHNPEHVLQVLESLRGLGLSLAIDDFGTGYASLAYLHRFPLDKLKIDQSFVRGLARSDDPVSLRNAEGIVRAMVNLGHQLQLRVLAEGVESEAQLHRLTQLGCDAIQGYYYGRPLPAKDADRFLWDELALALARGAATSSGHSMRTTASAAVTPSPWVVGASLASR